MIPAENEDYTDDLITDILFELSKENPDLSILQYYADRWLEKHEPELSEETIQARKESFKEIMRDYNIRHRIGL